MSIGKAAYKSLDIRPDDSVKGPQGGFLVEAGWGTERKLKGTVDLVMRKAVKEARLSIEFRGIARTSYHTQAGVMSDAKTICEANQTLVDARHATSTSSLNGEARIFSFPFSLTLPSTSLPPNFKDGRVTINYLLRATLQWAGFGKQTKDWDVPVEIVLPNEARTKMLVNPKPVTITNSEEMADSTAQVRGRKENFKYHIHLPHRVIAVQEPITATVRLTDLPTDPKHRVSHITATLQCTRRYTTSQGGSTHVNPACTISEILPEDGNSQYMRSWDWGVSLKVPEKVDPTMESPFLALKYHVAFEIYAEVGGGKPVTTVDVPVVILPKGPRVDVMTGDTDGVGDLDRVLDETGSVASLPRSRSGSVRSRQSVGSGFNGVMRPAPVNDSASSIAGVSVVGSASSGSSTNPGKLYRAIASYAGNLDDEIRMRDGDFIIVKDQYDDGWAWGHNTSTGQNGFVYLEYLVHMSNTPSERHYRSPPQHRPIQNAHSVHGDADSAYNGSANNIRSGSTVPSLSDYTTPSNGVEIRRGLFRPSQQAQLTQQPRSPQSVFDTPQPFLGRRGSATGSSIDVPRPSTRMYNSAASEISGPAHHHANAMSMGHRIASPPPSAASAASSHSDSSPQGTGNGNTYVCISTWMPERSDQIAIDIGDIIIVRTLFDDGFAWGLNTSRQQSGLFPLHSVTQTRNPAPVHTTREARSPRIAPTSSRSPAVSPIRSPLSYSSDGELPWPETPRLRSNPSVESRRSAASRGMAVAVAASQVRPGSLALDPPPVEREMLARLASINSIGENGAGGPTSRMEPVRTLSVGAGSNSEPPRSLSIAGPPPKGMLPPPPVAPLPVPPLGMPAMPQPPVLDKPSKVPFTEEPGTVEEAKEVVKSESEPTLEPELPPTPPAEPNADKELKTIATTNDNTKATVPVTAPAVAADQPASIDKAIVTPPTPPPAPVDPKPTDTEPSSTPPLTLPRTTSTLPRTKPASSTTSPGPASFTMYRVVYDFTPTLADEMEARKGDIILVKETYEDQWAFGKNLSRNKEGVFPIGLTERIEA